ncbi:hypothetical protein Poli38472_014087 [Pythium oligandrum]|uniref:Uncharacterized protein n=1 Tax=Pythium oligandrum TaxID=41045 RepID=A0A8K1CNV0_PYTOL|nr:hypothetical protein Poli38472_014087 [Pythium oligandrum]|eukprot:TMW66775.1 hypothetical protein Poli38472_014087 [Pythium oligandrum]
MRTIRVDVQNAPRRAEAAMDAPFVVRVATDAALTVVQQAIATQLTSIGADPDAAAAFDMEVYDVQADSYEPLTHMNQLGRRARVNVVLHQNTQSSPDDTCLALPSRLFPVDTTQGEFQINGHAVLVGEVENSGLGTGLTTWDGSIVLAKYLEHRFGNGQLHGKRVLEVGAGTGLVGISAGLLGAEQVLLTDLAYTMDNLARNVELTGQHAQQIKARVQPVELDWFQPRSDLGDFDLILASDVVWVEELVRPLVQTLQTLVRNSQRSTRVLMSHQTRSVLTDERLFRELEAHGFQRRLVPTAELHPDFVSDRIRVWELELS